MTDKPKPPAGAVRHGLAYSIDPYDPDWSFSRGPFGFRTAYECIEAAMEATRGYSCLNEIMVAECWLVPLVASVPLASSASQRKTCSQFAESVLASLEGSGYSVCYDSLLKSEAEQDDLAAAMSACVLRWMLDHEQRRYRIAWIDERTAERWECGAWTKRP